MFFIFYKFYNSLFKKRVPMGMPCSETTEENYIDTRIIIKTT